MKAKKRSRPSPVEILTCDPGCFFEFTDTNPNMPIARNHKNGKPRGAVRKNGLAVSDRQRLRDIEVWLNNCVNRAQAIETKRAAKVIELLCDVRSQVQKLRG